MSLLEECRLLGIERFQRRQHHLRIDLAVRFLTLLALHEVDLDHLARHQAFEVERDPDPERRE